MFFFVNPNSKIGEIGFDSTFSIFSVFQFGTINININITINIEGCTVVWIRFLFIFGSLWSAFSAMGRGFVE
jgi:hypothetical protein